VIYDPRFIPTDLKRDELPWGTRERFDRLAIEARKVPTKRLKYEARRAATRRRRLSKINRIEARLTSFESAAIDFAVALLEAMGEIGGEEA